MANKLATFSLNPEVAVIGSFFEEKYLQRDLSFIRFIFLTITQFRAVAFQ
jgi:hypothetical protein